MDEKIRLKAPESCPSAESVDSRDTRQKFQSNGNTHPDNRQSNSEIERDDLGYLLHYQVMSTIQMALSKSTNMRRLLIYLLLDELIKPLDSGIREHLSERPSHLCADSVLPDRYYALLSEYYVQSPNCAEYIINANVYLWNCRPYQILFTLLLHSRFFIYYKPDHESSIKQLIYLIKGANRLFWMDLESNNKTFFYIWNFLHRVVTQSEYWRGVVKKKYMDLFDLVAKFYFYYMPDFDQFNAFITSTQILFDKNKSAIDIPPNYSNLDTLNIFCIGTIRILRLIKNERAVILYLSCCLYFRNQELSISSSKSHPDTSLIVKAAPGDKPRTVNASHRHGLRLLNGRTRVLLANTLDDLATPGYPLYPTQSIKKRSRQVINKLWPHGRFWRSSIKFLFRLLRPPSFFHWYQAHTNRLIRLLNSISLSLKTGVRSIFLALKTCVFHSA